VTKIYAVIDGIVTGILAFEKKEDADAWATQNQEGGETLELAVQEVAVYPDVQSAPKHPQFF
jgi:hypothetical protein